MEAEMVKIAGPDLFWAVVGLLCISIMESIWLFYGLWENKRLRRALSSAREMNVLIEKAADNRLEEQRNKLESIHRLEINRLESIHRLEINRLESILNRYRNPNDPKFDPGPKDHPKEREGDDVRMEQEKIISDAIAGSSGPGGNMRSL